MHSPSKLYADLGENIPAGVAMGVDSGAADAHRAIEDMAGGPPSLGGGKGGGRAGFGGGTSLSIPINIDARGASKEAVQALTEGSILAQLTEAIEKICTAHGIFVEPIGNTPSVLPVGT
jgi:hypothetical protein